MVKQKQQLPVSPTCWSVHMSLLRHVYRPFKFQNGVVNSTIVNDKLNKQFMYKINKET